jgi:uncharacterized sulfatase
MDRRDFLKKASASGLGLALSRPLDTIASTRAQAKPNILFILIDQMRFPKVFPAGVTSVNQFLKQFMPHTHKLWKHGVKFSQHFGGTTACTPSRGVIITGLYSHQTWLANTITSGPNTKVSIPPVLDPGFPTYGKLLRQAGYQTPYIGKWHVSLQQLPQPLEVYGFDAMTKPDPTGSNLQGTIGDEANGYLSDEDSADQAVTWLSARTTAEQPWCLTVGFVNPHDHEFFWGGTEFQTYNDLFNSQSTYKPFSFYSSNKGVDYPPTVSWDDNIAKAPPELGYPTLPPNWESSDHLLQHKPAAHTFVRTFSQFVWGGVSEDASQTQFAIEPYPGVDGYGIGIAPYSYWQRSFDSYTQFMTIVDKQIGRVVNALPEDVASNTVIVFASDHGDYGGAHGLVTNKAATAYDECFHVPLIVVDNTGRLASDIDTIRDGLTSHVDLLNLFVSLGHNGSQSWLHGPIGEIYGNRHNMIPMLASAAAPGRDYILFATDELSAPQYNFNDASLHIAAMRTASEKIATYSKWRPYTTKIIPDSTEVEFYDYSTVGGRHETHNVPDDSRVQGLLQQLEILTKNELAKTLPGQYRIVQERARLRYLLFVQYITTGSILPKKLKQWLGYGQDF